MVDRALVVFSGETDLWWLRGLRPGFRHCFVAVEGGREWTVVDALSHQTFVFNIPKYQEFCLKSWYQNNGLMVVECAIRTSKRRIAPPLAYSCVESVKRILGIHSLLVMTPWQLYRHLNKT